jgi:RNA polymerase-binding transcription factor DksA
VTNPKESLHFGCCFCGKEMPKGKRLPVDFAIICLDCSVGLRKLKHKQEAFS